MRTETLFTVFALILVNVMFYIYKLLYLLFFYILDMHVCSNSLADICPLCMGGGW